MGKQCVKCSNNKNVAFGCSGKFSNSSQFATDEGRREGSARKKNCIEKRVLSAFSHADEVERNFCAHENTNNFFIFDFLKFNFIAMSYLK